MKSLGNTIKSLFIVSLFYFGLIQYADCNTDVGKENIGGFMESSEFWEIINKANQAANDAFDRPQSLRVLLNELEPSDIQGFCETYKFKFNEAYTWPLWGAAYVINGGCSDDCFDYFRDWLISEGKEIFENALMNPESLAELPIIEEAELEEFRYVADEVYEEKTGQDMNPRSIPHPTDPAGREWDEDEVYNLFPQLTEKYQ